MPKNPDAKIKRLERGPLQRFRNQNAVLKKFGEEGLRVYKAADGKRTVAEIAGEAAVELDFALEVAAWLEDAGMAEISGQEAGKKETPAPEKKEGAAEPGEEKGGGEGAEAPAEEIVAVAEGKKPAQARKGRLREIVEQETKGGEEEKKVEGAPESEEEIKPIGEEAGAKGIEEEITPVSEATEGEKEAVEEKETAEEKTIGEEAAPAEERPPEPEEKKAAEPEAEEAEKPEEKTAEEEKAGAESGIEPEEERREMAAPEEGETGEPELNPVERTIREKYGDVGLKVYSLIDGQKTAEEIMNETGVSEAKLIEMLEFMEKQGIIKLEHPESKAAAEAAEEKEKFAPLADQTGAGQVKETNPIEVPSKPQLGIIGGIQTKMKIALDYGERGTKVFNAIDGRASDVDISARTGVPLYDVRNILSFLSTNRIVKMKAMEREEVSRQYGEDCFSIYKRYGREGVLLYELIGKDIGIKQMARLVTKEKDMFAEMFVFIHKVLGVDIPIDKDVIYAQLEGKG